MSLGSIHYVTDVPPSPTQDTPDSIVASLVEFKGLPAIKDGRLPMGVLEHWAKAIAEAGGAPEDVAQLLSAASAAGEAAAATVATSAPDAGLEAAFENHSLGRAPPGARLPIKPRACASGRQADSGGVLRPLSADCAHACVSRPMLVQVHPQVQRRMQAWKATLRHPA